MDEDNNRTPPSSSEPNAGVLEAVRRAGSRPALARSLGVSVTAVRKYEQVNCPAERAVQIEAATGVSRELIRPDLWPAKGEK